MVDIKISDDKKIMTITVDLDNFVDSKSGKSKVISTKGFAPVEGTDYKVSLNVIKPKQ